MSSVKVKAKSQWSDVYKILAVTKCFVANLLFTDMAKRNY